MTLFKRDVSIDFDKIDSREFDAWCESMNLKPNEIDNLPVEVEVDVSISDFDEEEVIDRYREIMGGDWVERAYRYMAEGNVEAAMDEMHRELGLAPPSHECAVADLLTAGRI